MKLHWRILVPTFLVCKLLGSFLTKKMERLCSGTTKNPPVQSAALPKSPVECKNGQGRNGGGGLCCGDVNFYSCELRDESVYVLMFVPVCRCPSLLVRVYNLQAVSLDKKVYFWLASWSFQVWFPRWKHPLEGLEGDWAYSSTYKYSTNVTVPLTPPPINIEATVRQSETVESRNNNVATILRSCVKFKFNALSRFHCT